MTQPGEEISFGVAFREDGSPAREEPTPGIELVAPSPEPQEASPRAMEVIEPMDPVEDGSEPQPVAPPSSSFVPIFPTFRPDVTPEFRATIEGLATLFNNTGQSAHRPIEIVEPQPPPPIPRPSPQELVQAILDPTEYEAAHQAIDAFADRQRNVTAAADTAR